MHIRNLGAPAAGLGGRLGCNISAAHRSGNLAQGDPQGDRSRRTLFDTRHLCRRGGSETVLGEVLGPRRKDIVLATKFSRR